MTREEWLHKAVEVFRPWFDELGAPLPPKLYVSVGFPSTGARSHRIGECWSPGNGDPHLFIHPRLTDSCEVLATLLHELVHASGQMNHGAGFRRIAVAVGLTGKMTATYAGPHLQPVLTQVVEKIGPYPHTGLPVGSSRKKQTTRNLKVQATGCCGYTARVTRKWLDEVGPPMCPHGNPMDEV